MSTQSVPSTDEERLAQLGYQQELHRRLSGFSNFAVSFSIISILLCRFCRTRPDAIRLRRLCARRVWRARRLILSGSSWK